MVDSDLDMDPSLTEQSTDRGRDGRVPAEYVHGDRGTLTLEEQQALCEERSEREAVLYKGVSQKRTSERLRALRDPRILRELSLAALERMWYDASFSTPNNQRGVQAIRDRKLLLFEVERLRWKTEELEARLASK
jgi:hypothetical protein